MANRIGPAPNHNPDRPMTALPPDEVMLETALVEAIYQTFLSVPHLTEYVNIEKRERYPDTNEEDITVTTKPDPIVPSIERTSLIEIGLPSVAEGQNSSDVDTQLNFIYPIKFDLQVVDQWDDVNNLLYYKNSRDLYMAVYMVSRRAFKNDRTMGYNNCEHQYLQQVQVNTAQEEETDTWITLGDWTLEIRCRGILV